MRCGRDRVLRLMCAAGLRAQRGYRRPRGYYHGWPHAVVPNRLDQQFRPKHRALVDVGQNHRSVGAGCVDDGVLATQPEQHGRLAHRPGVAIHHSAVSKTVEDARYRTQHEPLWQLTRQRRG